MRRILIIEDEKLIRDLYVLVFSRSGYEVEEAVDGADAIEKVKANLYDVILLDIMLPKINGLDVLKFIRDPGFKAHETPVFLITNLGQEDIIKKAFDMGADGYLLKAQLTPKDIVNEIQTFFDKHPELIKPQV
jgi:two-component system response regulator ResD